MNKEIELLHKKIEAQDKIINTQALEIARLKEDKKKAIEYIKYVRENVDIIEHLSKKIVDDEVIRKEEINKLLQILGDKENE